MNCSWILQTGWYIVRSFLDAKTRGKINILGGEFQKALLEHVLPENLPDFLGGTCQCKPNGCLNQSEGPWKQYYEKFPREEDPADASVPSPPAKWPVAAGVESDKAEISEDQQTKS